MKIQLNDKTKNEQLIILKIIIFPSTIVMEDIREPIRIIHFMEKIFNNKHTF